MPIYEYYCKACHTIFNFYAKTFSVTKEPACPRCRGPLKKHVSSFSLGGRMQGPDRLPMNPDRLSEGMKRLASFEEKDPKEAARLRKKFSEMTGVSFEENSKKPGRPVPGTAQPDMLPDGSQNDEYKPGVAPERDETLYDLD